MNLCKPTPVNTLSWLPLRSWATYLVLEICFVYGFRQVLLWSSGRFYFVGAILFSDKLQTHFGGASIREGASNKDITVPLKINSKNDDNKNGIFIAWQMLAMFFKNVCKD